MAGRRGNGQGGTPVEVKRRGRPNTWGVRTPEHEDLKTGERLRYWIGRDYKNKTEAAKALTKWLNEREEEIERHKEEAKAAAEAESKHEDADLTMAQLLDRWLDNHRGEGTTTAGYEPKIRLHIKPHVGDVKVSEVTDKLLDALYRRLEAEPCPTNHGEPLGPKTVLHIHNIISAALTSVTGPMRLLTHNPAHFAEPPTERQVKASEPDKPTLTDAETKRFLADIWTPCGNRKCDGGLTHHCLRDAPLWTSYAATGCRRSEVLGWRWDLVNWEEGCITLGWVVVEEGKTYRLRKLTKEGEDDAVIYVDQSLMDVLRWQWERQQYEKEVLGDLWVDHGLVFARDSFKLFKRSRAGGPQDPEKVSARWRTRRDRLDLPEEFGLHGWRRTKITNDLEGKENPVEVSANARHRSGPGYTMKHYGQRRADNAKRLAASSASRIGLAGVAPASSRIGLAGRTPSGPSSLPVLAA
ncbi:tyrosine-type recombinase/integrase [Streptomyces stramineus]|uniref:Tyr recombinase domain-containing protein n=1 Tax=Streptomyces stramineus TaxID=173861 RepID=A0ABP3JJN5_9ACTN